MTELATLPSLSDCESGKLNAQTLHCPGNQASMLYAACLARLKACDSKEPGLPKDWAACVDHRRSGLCEASRMREQEIAAGKALFFKPRLAPVETRLPSSFGAPVEKPTRSPRKPPSVMSSMAGMGRESMADAVNAMLASPVAPAPKPSRPAAPMPAMLPGESPLQFARRIASLRAEQPTT